MIGAVARWWDGVELWATGLPFLAQVTLVLAVVAPLAVLAATGLDRVLAAVAALSRPDAAGEPSAGGSTALHDTDRDPHP